METTVKYDEQKCDLFNEIITKFAHFIGNINRGNNCIAVCDEATAEGKVVIRVDQIDHMEVL